METDTTDFIEDHTTSASFKREEVVSLCKSSLNFIASFLMPLQFTAAFPSLHLVVWDLLLKTILSSEKPNPTPKEKFPQIAIGWPRGHAKTTLVKLFVLWCIFFSKKKFILIVASNVSKAENIIADICDMLSEENVLNLFGNWKIYLDKDTTNLKKFHFLGRDIILAAIGSGGDPRGLNIKNARPDVIVMDDMQSKENSESPTVSKQLLSWMNSTLKKAKSPHGCVFIYVGNMFSSNGCILKILRKNPEWISVIVAGILADGTALWPELRSKEELLQELKEDIAMGVPEAFFSEIMNDENSGVTSCFDVTKVPLCPFLPQEDHVSASFIIIDVASDKIGADDTTIIYYEAFDGIPVATELVSGIFSPGDLIRKTLTICLKRGCYLVVAEDVAYQTSLLYWFNYICQEAGIEGIHFEPVSPRGRSKTARILTMLKSLIGTQTDKETNGKPSLYLREELRPKVFWEISQYKPDKKNNEDNILDNLSYAQDVMSDYAALTWNPLSVESVAFSEASVIDNNSAF